ncbi:hypothetical protein DNTS_014290 [Danionella cerebrum]|uniref:Uncharacterized protein n=1 Tax=Danionella cerebrum TaxID=2873325 RepID=A0A553R455_9TELE|nr:hypothetical protein DNTS_014290 [Danionella translucida]TRY96947.1 hypothetical protein DNTS_014290 [Danionella translucida]
MDRLFIGFLLLRATEIVYENTRPKEASNCWRYRQNPMGICHTATSKKIDNIKPLRKYDAYTDQVGHRL